MKKILYCLLLVAILAGASVFAAQISFIKSGGVTDVSDTLALPSNPHSSITVASIAADPDPLAAELNPAMDFILREIRFQSSETASEGTLTITVDANDGAAYDNILITDVITSVSEVTAGHYRYAPAIPIYCESGDKIDVACNWDAGNTVTLQYVWERR